MSQLRITPELCTLAIDNAVDTVKKSGIIPKGKFSTRKWGWVTLVARSVLATTGTAVLRNTFDDDNFALSDISSVMPRSSDTIPSLEYYGDIIRKFAWAYSGKYKFPELRNASEALLADLIWDEYSVDTSKYEYSLGELVEFAWAQVEELFDCVTDREVFSTSTAVGYFRNVFYTEFINTFKSSLISDASKMESRKLLFGNPFSGHLDKRDTESSSSNNFSKITRTCKSKLLNDCFANALANNGYILCQMQLPDGRYATCQYTLRGITIKAGTPCTPADKIPARLLTSPAPYASVMQSAIASGLITNDTLAADYKCKSFSRAASILYGGAARNGWTDWKIQADDTDEWRTINAFLEDYLASGK